MAKVPAQSFYNGPFAVYTSATGMTNPRTGLPYLGGTLHEGDYCDLSLSDAAEWNVRFGVNLNTGRYRFVRVQPASTASTIKFGLPVGWGLGTSLSMVAIAGSGSVTGATNGQYLCSSSASGGIPATALVTVQGAVITAAQLVFPGANFTSVPTFALTEITGYTGGAGPLLAQMYYSPNLVGSFDTTASGQISMVRAIAIVSSITTAQIQAGAWIVVQELGIAPVYVTTATATVPGSIASAATGGVVTTTTISTPIYSGYIGQTLDTAAADTNVRVVLDLPEVQG
ncbi:MAG: hypothetical protein ACP5EP_11430 [Acidobacteriaceae bacterium]